MSQREKMWEPTPPEGIPWWLIVADVCVVGAGMVAVFWLRKPELAFVVMLGAGALTAMVVRFRATQFQKLLVRHERLLCLRCHYPVSGLATSGVCPECREPYEHESLARIWHLWELQHRIIPDPLMDKMNRDMGRMR